jgi:hypothetical protein
MQDITKAEIKRMQTALENFPNGTGDEQPCLKYGCIGSGRKRQGVLVVLDGQNIFPDSEKVLRIRDERSPFNGMMAADYFEYIVKPFQLEAAKLLDAYQVEVTEAARTGIDPSNIPKKRPPLPGWPGNIKHYEWK